MLHTKDIAVFDLEVSNKDTRINDIGVRLNGQAFRCQRLEAFTDFTKSARWWCGHNIVDHDLKILERVGIDQQLLDRPAIDTLYLSALLFPKQPYHKLVKDYQLDGTELNNPLADARLAEELLESLILAFRNLPSTIQSCYFNLLHRQDGFNGFFEFLEGAYPPKIYSTKELSESLKEVLSGLVCTRADISDCITSQPVELAYAIALIRTDDPDSIPPAWVLHRFPGVQTLINRLRSLCDGRNNCRYCQFLNPRVSLRRYFGFDDFRYFEGDGDKSLQEQVVEAAMADRSLLAIFPTGGGKSLTFQLPALIRGEANRALTVIISPLQSLMKDQVDVLHKRHDITMAVTINGMLSPLERSDAIERVKSGGANLLYISPESLRSNSIYKLLMGRYIDRFVIDEAHCFSSWGQDFRVDYLYIGRFLRKLQIAKQLSDPIPVSCFTATAKPAVIEDIQNYFLKENLLDLELFQTQVKRKNLQYFVYEAVGKEAKYKRLCELLKSEEGPKIVYVARVKRAEHLAENLKRDGLNARAYHGKLDRDDKNKIQDEFMASDGGIEVIVATTAFGMGVDKDNIRMVVHYNISSSLENYMQESGRAGRKADINARCYILFDENDLSDHFNLLNQTKLSRKDIYQIWQAIKRFRKKQFTKSALEIARQAGWEEGLMQLETRVKTAIAVLERGGFIKREENSGRIFTQSILVKNVDQANKIIDQHAEVFKGADEVKLAKRIFSHLMSRSRTKKEIQIDYMSDTLGIDRNLIAQILPILKQLKILHDDKDLTAYFYTVRGARHSSKVFQKLEVIERGLWKLVFNSEKEVHRKIFLKELNEKLHEQDVKANISILRDLLNYWELVGLIKKERIDRIHFQYHLHRKISLKQFEEKVEDRLKAAAWALTIIEKYYLPNAKVDSDFSDKSLIEFSLLDFKEKIEKHSPKVHPIRFYEKLLLYLHHGRIIELKSGLLVYYNPMKIVRTELDNSRRYTQKDYELLAEYYQSKVAQIHVVGEYARKQLKFAEEAIQFADDYFTMPYETFLNKYFKNRLGKIRRPITEEKFQRIFGSLSSAQIQVIKDKVHQHILVAAGPGSGKTRVLVHKVAALLLMEDIKPVQFLMLTFSRPAAMEFRQRLHALVGSIAFNIDIFTYHGFAFQLSGRLGDLEKAQHILPQVTEAIRKKELPLEQLRCKAVIVVDEFQDVSDEEYDFLSTIIETAEEPRVIAVGDDDQNIYEFRGANLQHMRNFVLEQNAKVYYLSENYRSKANLLAFSNQYLKQFIRGERLKKEIDLVAVQKDHGRLGIIQYNSPYLIEGLVAQIQGEQLEGETALLTHRNEEALLLYSLLRQRGIPAQLLAEQSGFQVRQILEVAAFSHWLAKTIKDQSGSILDEDWKKVRDHTLRHFRHSGNLELIRRLIQSFESVNPKKFQSNWNQYLREIRPSDLYAPEEERLLVATMHKVKGKEFDNVFILLQHYPMQTEEQRRVLYVALTRAKKYLQLHTNSIDFPVERIPRLNYQRDNRSWAAPQLLLLQCGLSDIWLGFCTTSEVQAAIRPLLPGMPLEAIAGHTAFQSAKGEIVCRLSKAFQQKLQKHFSQGYALKKVTIAHIVMWYDPKSARNYRVVLPGFELIKAQAGGTTTS